MAIEPNNKYENSIKQDTVVNNNKNKLIHIKFERYESRLYVGKLHIDVNHMSLFIATVAAVLTVYTYNSILYGAYIFLSALIFLILADSVIGFFVKVFNFTRLNRGRMWNLFTEFVQFLVSDKEYPSEEDK